MAVVALALSILASPSSAASSEPFSPDRTQRWIGAPAWSNYYAGWKNEDSGLNTIWAQNYAVFGHEGFVKNIFVEPSVSFRGIRFEADGYLLSGNLTVGWPGDAVIDAQADARIDANINGFGGITKIGSGELVLGGSNTYFGDTRVEGGTLRVVHNYALGDLGNKLVLKNATFGNAVNSGVSVTHDIVLEGDGTFDVPNFSLGISGNISGNFDLHKTGQGIFGISGQNSYRNTYIEAGELLGTADAIKGDVYNAGKLQFLQNSDGRFDGSIKNLPGSQSRGSVSKTGGGTLTLGGISEQDWTLEGGGLSVDADKFKGGITHSNGNTNFTLNHSGDTRYAGGAIKGYADVTIGGSGTLILGGTHSYTGDTNLKSGALKLESDASIGPMSLLTVHSGATLFGSGAVGSTIVRSGGTIDMNDPSGLLQVNGHLTLEAGSSLNYTLGRGAIDPTSGTSGRLAITGDLNIVGPTLNVFQSSNPSDGNIGGGYYRLATYGGNLNFSNLMWNMPQLPVGTFANLYFGGGNVDLLVASLGDNSLQHWQGGDGYWTDWSSRWLNQDGTFNSLWASKTAVFKDANGFQGGDIDVIGPQTFQGLQFVDDGYTLGGIGPLVIDGSTRSDGNAEIRVLADNAVINTQIAGSGGLTKTEAGRLVLNGNNGYAGGTSILGGIVAVSSDANLGAASGGVTLAGGGLQATNSFSTQREFNLARDGQIAVDANKVLRLDGTVSGQGDLHKTGDGHLYLTGQNTYGDTYVHGGSLMGDTSTISGDVYNAGWIDFTQNFDGQFNGSIKNLVGAPYAGNVQKRGAGTVTLGGVSEQDWFLNEGGLNIDADKFKGRISSSATGTSVTLNHNGDTQYSGRIYGSADVTIQGNGTLVLGNDNYYSGKTDLKSGSLHINTGKSIGMSSMLTIHDGAALIASGGVGNTTVMSGGSINATNPYSALWVEGDLKFEAGSSLNYALGAGASRPELSTNGRINVSGDLALNTTVNFYQNSDPAAGVFGAGYYRLATYGGALDLTGFTVGDMPNVPSGHDVAFTSGDGYFDLFINSPGDNSIQHWQGGTGSWSPVSDNWLNLNGSAPTAWASNIGVFKDANGHQGGDVFVMGQQKFKGLQFVDNGYVLGGVGQLAVDDNSELRVLSDVATINTQITGNGGIAKTEAGKLVLGGNNSYTGGTTIYGGTVAVSSDVNLGATSGAVTLAGGTLQATQSFNSQRAINLNKDGQIVVDENKRLQLSGTVAGEGNLLKGGAGTLVLAGEGKYGNTIVSGGQLIGNSTSISGDILNGTSVVFNQKHDGTFAGQIAGYAGEKGTMIKQGLGSLTLGGVSMIDWTVDEGTLVADAAKFGGNVLINSAGTFAFNQPINVTYGGVISGDGNFVKKGGGVLELTGNSSGFKGTITIIDGTISTGTKSNAGSLGGDTVIGEGGFLSGVGTVGNGLGSVLKVAEGGTLAPGNSIGTLTVNGNLVIEQGAVYEVEVNPEGTESDRVNVKGNATINGASVAHIGYNGNYAQNSRYTILSVDGTLTGSFGQITSEFAYLNPTLLYDYDAGKVDLELARNDVKFAAKGTTANHFATANAIESLGAGNEIYDAFVGLPDNQAVIAAGLDSLSGEIHASVTSAMIDGSVYVRDLANNRMRVALGGIELPSDSNQTAHMGGYNVWGSAYGGWNKLNGNGNAAEVKHNTGGFVVGADKLVDGDLLVGAFVGYGSTSINGRGSASVDSYHLGVYAAKQIDKLALRGGASYSMHEVETDRVAGFVGYGPQKLTSSYKAHTTQVFGEVGYKVETKVATFEPYLGLAYINHQADGYAEKGGKAALKGSKRKVDATVATIGVRASKDVKIGKTNAKVTVGVGYRHASNSLPGVTIHQFDEGSAFAVSGAPIARKAVILEAGVDVPLSKRANLNVHYQAQISSRSTQHTVGARFTYKF
ncbi:autotransporter domain-containing protein [Mesorhizobium sp. SP-1A]|uniref:autotransporter domain-containing protein n=1 Tax=Mesorhizobium sp. SP-1A TaxID=3077840 RepID=UPI0028F7253E|nr:autotransporter domain-containing protein [Mesorhizobium sp. SP-1A]